MQSKNLNSLSKMNDEFGIFVVKHLAIFSDKSAGSFIDETIKMTLCCCYAFTTTCLSSSDHSIALCLKIAQNLDFLLDNFSSLDNEIRFLAIAVMQNIYDLIKQNS